VNEVINVSRHGFAAVSTTFAFLNAHIRRAAIASDALLTTQRVRVYTGVLLAVGMIFHTTSVAMGHPPFDSFGHPLAIDLSNRVTAGRIVLNGMTTHLYDVSYQQAVQQRILGGSHPEFLDIYISPPFVAYLFAPLTAIRYEVAAGIWIALTLVLMAVNVRMLWRWLPNLHHHGFGVALVAILSAWPVIELVVDGQDDALALLILIGGLRLLLARRDFLAGALIGLGLFKPQLSLALPLLFLLQRRWAALGGWCTVALILASTSIAMLGSNGVGLYLRLLTSSTLREVIFSSLGWKMQSLLALTGSLVGGISEPIVAVVTIGIDLILLARLMQVASRVLSIPERFVQLYAVAIVIGSIVSPYFFLYDCVILLLPCVVFLNSAPKRPAVRLLIASSYVLTWTAPLRFLGFGRLPWPISVVAAPWTVLPLACLAWLFIQSLDQAESEARDQDRVGIS
jgi:hypothetical protein